METFEVQKDFLLNGAPFQIRSGAIHYFRVPREDWKKSLHNLKALGFNTVETYVPWNLHEPQEGVFDFDGQNDLEAFLETAKEMGLFAIVRPSPFICAEWEYGGLPWWLLKEPVKLRTNDPRFLDKVQKYYDVLLPKLKRHQLSEGGNVLMFQLENEYGSYKADKDYLKAIKTMMEKGGIDMPFFTSDGPWEACLSAGSLIDEDVLCTGNFGSAPEKNFQAMKAFMQEHGKDWPLMCMEFWDGWFGRYREPLVHRDPEELTDTIMETLKLGSINLYMFHGGTNFGFMNGCSARNQHDLPQLTSYDYGALLDEQGNPTKAWYLLQEKMKKAYPDLEYDAPVVKETMAVDAIPRSRKVSLFNTLPEPVASFDTQTMEDLDQGYGYVLYETSLPHWNEEEKLRIIDARDRAHLYLDGNLETIQYQEEIGEPVMVHSKEGGSNLKILVENMGRVNYGSKLAAPTQKKGISQGVMADLHFLPDWKQYRLPLDNLDFVNWSAGWTEGQPGFHEYRFEVEHPADTWLDISTLGKGAAFINGKNIGRYWNVGPMETLYVPGAFLKPGTNTITLFETEMEAPASLSLVDAPKEKKETQ